MTDVVWLSLKPKIPGRGMWDQQLLESLFKGSEHHLATDNLSGAVVVIPGAYQGQLVDKLNAELGKLKWCLVIVTSDEENKFPIDQLKHPRMKIWATYYNPKYKKVDRWLPIGPARFRKTPSKKDLAWFFAGQVNHKARLECVKALRKLTGGKLVETGGFAQGLPHAEYHRLLGQAKIVPAPRGNISPDSFRTYEALEAGAIPIVEDKAFWGALFGEVPFPIVSNWSQLPGYIEDLLRDWPANANRAVAWWIQRKRQLKRDSEAAIAELSQ